MEVDILIKNALVVTVNADREIIEEGSIAIKNGKIFEIFYGKKYLVHSCFLDLLFEVLLNLHQHCLPDLLI